MNTRTSHLVIDPRLDRILRPRSVAVVGASNDIARISGRPLRYLLEHGFDGTIYPINPKRDEVQGLKAWPSLASLPETPDVAILAIPAVAIPDTLKEAGQIGLPGAIIMASGFAEASEDGRALQDYVRDIAAEGGVRLIGPNCVGLFSTGARFYGTFTQSLDAGVPQDGGVAVVSQSGAYGGYIAWLARQRGLGVGTWITTGNEVDLEVGECVAWLAGQDEVKVIALYLEGIRNGPAFLDGLARARAAGKPVVAMKVGRSEAGARAATSHTASLAGADEVYDAIFREFGVYRAETTEEQLDIAEACLHGVFPSGNRLGILTLSGGVGVQMCDAAVKYGLDVPPMPQDAQAELKALLPYAAVTNPIDTTAQMMNDMSLVTKNLQMVLERGGYDSLVSFLTTVPGAEAYSGPLRDAILKGVEGFEERLAVLCMAAPEEAKQAYRDAGFVVSQDADRAVQIVGALTAFGQSFAAAAATRPVLPAPDPTLTAADTLSEHAAKQVLARAGVPFLPERLAKTRDEAAAFAKEVGTPLAMKVSSAQIQHKTEIGGVLLNVSGADAAAAAYQTLEANAARNAPDAVLDGILCAPMAPKGVEVIVGTLRDPVFGPVVMFGLGGVLVELFRDVTFERAPFDIGTARKMIGRVRSAPLLAGLRGAKPSDTEALAKLLSDVSCFAAANAETVVSMDLNPVLVLPEGDGVVALDAVVEPG
ncbi:acetate--CoA ligase family protein [Tropicimonas isoalkanivorans]|uniref:Acyl-CoA synthetase (NDP forming) n=1 Tax=Tropicimonas isoalkanivorans TaxID=441112 RepID=A0A1I1HS67_9RHOB|nr:acetate--CoA ligase family protein [Tropicimonas isoalkanivorans]SFC26774.1 Acyl-CoA synthetase (NDP forming) [Tropicimonas isoalkanivorans]